MATPGRRGLRLSISDANDWAPAVAVDSKGNAHVFWDTYERGDYDVVGRAVTRWNTGAATRCRRQATSSRRDHRSPSIGRTAPGLAYEIGERGWGKDNGRLIDKKRQPGSALNSVRSIAVRVASVDGRWMAAKPEIESLFKAPAEEAAPIPARTQMQPREVPRWPRRNSPSTIVVASTS